MHVVSLHVIPYKMGKGRQRCLIGEEVGMIYEFRVH